MAEMIVYDSFFGNTEKIAKSIGSAMGNEKQVIVIRVGEAKLEQLKDLKLLIVGSPTRAFRPSPAITDFLNRIPVNYLNGIKVASFDTRMPMNDKVPAILKFFAKLFGYASKPIADKLVRKGGSLVVEPEGFFVENSEGPLAQGELERATKWAKTTMKGL
jgi:flavodoxin I